MSNQSLNNPALIASAAASNPEAVNSVVKTARTLVFVGGIVAGGYFARKWYKDWQKQQFVEKNAHLPDVQAAMIMRKAMKRVDVSMFPFGSINIPDGTDEDALNALALKVTSLENVIKAYKILFESNLMIDVQSELDSDELLAFFNRLNASDDYENPDPGPYLVGQDIKVSNPRGANVFEVIELEDGGLKGGDEIDFLEFDEEVGTIIDVVRGDVTGRIFYRVDRDGVADWLYGNGYIPHSEVRLVE